MSEGFEFKISDVDVRVRRCYDDGADSQIVEFTIEKFSPSWFLASLCLTQEEAILLASALLSEATTPLPHSIPDVAARENNAPSPSPNRKRAA